MIVDVTVSRHDVILNDVSHAINSQDVEQCNDHVRNGVTS